MNTSHQLEEVEEQEELKLSPKARERDLMAIIANKDKRIQQLQDKLEAQTAFVDAVLKLSDGFKSISSQKSRRRVSWCPSVDQDLLKKSETTNSNNKAAATAATAVGGFEINVDDILDDIDDLSILSSEDEEEKKTEDEEEKKEEPAEASEPPPKQEDLQPELDAEKPKEPENAMVAPEEPKEPENATVEPVVGLSIVGFGEAEEEEESTDSASLVEYSLVQAIIAELRDDSDSISL